MINQIQWRKQFIALALKRAKPGSGSSLEFLNTKTWTLAVTNLNSLIQRTPFVIIGGVATRLYMPERMTLDLDILVFTQNAPQLYQELEQAGSRRIGSLRIGGNAWELPDNSSLDVIESDEIWVPTAIANPQLSPDGLPIIALPYLVLLKLQASRSQDLADISRMLGNVDANTLETVRTIIRTYLIDAVEDLESLIYLGQLEYRSDG